MNEGELLGISSYPQLLGVMRELRGQLERDLEVTGNKIPVLKANLVRVERALAILEGPAKQRRTGKRKEWSAEQREAAADRMRKANAARRAAKGAGGDGRRQVVCASQAGGES